MAQLGIHRNHATHAINDLLYNSKTQARALIRGAPVVSLLRKRVKHVLGKLFAHANTGVRNRELHNHRRFLRQLETANLCSIFQWNLADTACYHATAVGVLNAV